MNSSRMMAAMMLLGMLCGCTALRNPSVRSEMIGRDTRQVVVVITPGWDAPNGQLQRFSRDGLQWVAVGEPVAVSVGRTGSAWGRGLHPTQADGLQKREGDGRAPAGVFEIGEAFGYVAQTRTGLAYQALDADDWCIDVEGSPHYNRIVDSKEVGVAATVGSTEPMRRDLHLDGDQRYREGFVIEHNPERVSGGGSCIFAHLWKAPGAPTAGCTAMAADDLSALLAWLNAKHKPLFVLLPTHEYSRLQMVWGLPDISHQ